MEQKSLYLNRLSKAILCIERLSKLYRTKDRVLALAERKQVTASIDSLELFREIDYAVEQDESFGPLSLHISNTFEEAYKRIVELLQGDFEAVLIDIEWPKINSDRLKSSQFVPKLLHFLKLKPKSHYVPSLLAPHPVFLTFSKTFETGFHYHFKGKKKTNLLNKVIVVDLARVLYDVSHQYFS
jgi:hypothetical protein